MSGSRSNRDGGSFEDPVPGAESWSSSNTGSAPYSPYPNAAGVPAPRRQPPALPGRPQPQTPHEAPYAPYGDGAVPFGDPYGEPRRADGYAPEPYPSGQYAPEQYPSAPDAYPSDPYGREPYTGPATPDSGQYATQQFQAAPYGYNDDAYPQQQPDRLAPGYDESERGRDRGQSQGQNQDPGQSREPGGRGRRRAAVAALPATGLLERPRQPQDPDRYRPDEEQDEDQDHGAPSFGEPGTRLPRQGGRRGGSAADETESETEPARRGSRSDGGGRTRPRLRSGPAARAIQGLVVASLVIGITAVVTFEKTINLSVDGSVHQVHTFSSTVGAVLSGDGISTGSHDSVLPALNTSLSDGATVTVRYGRPIDVTVNGTADHVWVHYPTVGGALQELGVRTTGARLSVPADTPISRAGGLAFSVYTLRHVTFLVDGKTVQLDTTAATISQAIQQAGIALQNQDTSSVPLTALPTDNETISILRITGTTEVKQVSVPYTVTQESDASVYSGSTTVETAGVDGTAEVTYAMQTINGVVQPPKELSRVVTKQPVNEVEEVGTKALPSNVADLDWAALANCESGGRATAVSSNGMYYGLYQFSVSTWDTLGGTGLPSQASPAEQTDLAELLYERSGSGQWPVCGPNLFN